MTVVKRGSGGSDSRSSGSRAATTKLGSAYLSADRPESKISGGASSSSNKKHMRAKKCLIITAVVMAVLAVFGLVAVFAVHGALGYPWHASCKIDWEFGASCDSVRTGIVNQMNEWKGDDCPGTSDTCPKMPCGQKCLYSYEKTDDDGTVHGHHKTPVKKYKDNMTFKFEAFRKDSKDHCKVEAFSTSEVWYAYLDFGTNYCNLRNLIDGAKLSETAGFLEATDTSVCTQYDRLDCERF